MACKPDGSWCERCGQCAYACPETALESLRINDPVFYGSLLGQAPNAPQKASEGPTDD